MERMGCGLGACRMSSWTALTRKRRPGYSYLRRTRRHWLAQAIRTSSLPTVLFRAARRQRCYSITKTQTLLFDSWTIWFSALQGYFERELTGQISPTAVTAGRQLLRAVTCNPAWWPILCGERVLFLRSEQRFSLASQAVFLFGKWC